jgi:hypothetical protein
MDRQPRYTASAGRRLERVADQLVATVEGDVRDEAVDVPDPAHGRRSRGGDELLSALRAAGPEGAKVAHVVERGELGYPSRGGLGLARRLAADGVEVDRAGSAPTTSPIGGLVRVDNG